MIFEPSVRKLTQKQKNDRVTQSFGARTACLELLRRVKDPDAQREIIKQGKAAEESIIECGGMFMGQSFEIQAYQIILESGRCRERQNNNSQTTY